MSETQPTLEELLATAESALHQEPERIAVSLAGEVVEIECPYIGGIEWSNLVAEHPPRPNSASDLVVGYNEAGLVYGYLKRHGKMIRGATQRITPSAEEWDRFLDVTGAPVINALSLTLYVQNVQMPMDRAVAAGKG